MDHFADLVAGFSARYIAPGRQLAGEFYAFHGDHKLATEWSGYAGSWLYLIVKKGEIFLGPEGWNEAILIAS